ncbi:Strong similarity to gi/2160138 F19K23.6 gene product from A. thaliana BAC gb/AC000375 [Arabidopsis thaliana]|uniref:At1g61980 n=1 Tax=Arabidopsis thaliana TaxID=3702 RepID=O80703_ARATH|nr:Mitochondrial transcription termination factor family protein [Arabidopsis thaliana]NP_001320795.1 Mitochondrial transcription termination factor family protein [Arabidopsis thaliana]NP_176389.1 Mitochondrial transcription termination factor family protein [Arabidopsis thaliana]AAC28513.1 Strong similarity to gi/2160138 F19K23.6 gene product from A. thaliana BAC gb/AC000375 [Arabidopsis thaliana]ABM06016.1 At1g61980 [Arabidopsis thaliana]AEE33910.1 Mitochondrial transcription termination fa|eukprot:NP_001319290.1 Mitochondrial transcription termination factor family protein [Arabidopsis thaliana]
MYSLIRHGRSLVELQKWRHLRVLVQKASPLSNSFSSASAARLSPRVGRKGKSFTVSYLVDSLGLPKKLAESVSRKVSFEDKDNPDSVLNLLRSHGFTDSQISTIVTDYPQLLVADAEKSLAPKLQFLQSRGASSSELTEIVSTVPKILGKRGHKTISVFYDFIKETLLDKSSKSEKSCQPFPQGNLENKIRNLSVLRELGMPHKLLFPLLISCDVPVFGKEKFEESLKKVVEMGFDPSTSKFVEALCVVQRLSDKNIEDKVNAYKRLGFDVEYVWTVFKRWPNFLTHSEKKILNTIETFLGLGFSRDEFSVLIKRFPQGIGLSAEMVKKKTEFLVKKMNWPLKALVSNPAVLGYSLEKRTVPRGNVVQALISKGLIGSELPSISRVFVCTDQVFLNRYVKRHEDKQLETELMAIYRAS